MICLYLPQDTIYSEPPRDLWVFCDPLPQLVKESLTLLCGYYIIYHNEEQISPAKRKENILLETRKILYSYYHKTFRYLLT